MIFELPSAYLYGTNPWKAGESWAWEKELWVTTKRRAYAGMARVS